MRVRVTANKMPRTSHPGTGAAQGQEDAMPWSVSPDPAAPILWDGLYEDDPVETTYRKIYADFYGDDEYEDAYEVSLKYRESRLQWIIDIVWGGCIFGAGCLIGFALGIAVGGGW